MTMTELVLPPELIDGDIQIRRAAVKVEDITEEGIVECRIMPYEHEIELIPGLREVVTRGAFSSACGNPSRVKVSDQGHQRQVIIGHAVELRDEPKALFGKLKIADTAAGRDVLTLLRGGTLTELSAEFRPQEKFWRRTQHPAGGRLWRHDRATLVGVSPVGQGAYAQEARVLAVREAAMASAAEQVIAQLDALRSGPKRG
jgi:HK97 family phage prohead protease